MKKCAIIMNPESGKIKSIGSKKNFYDILRKYGYDAEIKYTRKAKDATEIVKNLPNDIDLVISAGGDGTLNEVVNGLVYGKCKLGIIPTGSGNDFYRCLNNYQHKNKKIDLGKVNGKYFINISSVGINAETFATFDNL